LKCIKTEQSLSHPILRPLSQPYGPSNLIAPCSTTQPNFRYETYTFVLEIVTAVYVLILGVHA
jgi:hypothetical protein